MPAPPPRDVSDPVEYIRSFPEPRVSAGEDVTRRLPVSARAASDVLDAFVICNCLEDGVRLR